MTATDSDADYTLIHLMLKAGHLLNLKVVGEGVETDLQAALLSEMGCDTLQGFLFSRPMDAAATEALLAETGSRIMTG